MATPTDAHKPLVVLSGGGTGGHITPIIAVAYELKQLNPAIEIVYIGEKGGKFKDLTDTSPDIDRSYAIQAGKLRRYHGESLLTRLADVKTNALNLRDAFLVSLGVPSAWRLLGKLKPDVVFLKGGYVGVPVGIAAAARRIPIVTHDSDAIPGLANRLVGRWAKLHATALPAEFYAYDQAKVQSVGVLVGHNFQSVTPEVQADFKEQLGLPREDPLLLITGGSLGAQRINEAAAKLMPALLASHPTMHVIHQAGKGKADVYGTYTDKRLQVLEFMKPMHVYTGAADLIVSRASANTLAELGVQGKACVAIPSQFLAAGHQLKNAERLEEQGAAIIVQEEQLYDLQQGLLPVIDSLLNDAGKRQELAQNLQSITIPDAAKRLARLILDQIRAS